MAMSLGVSSNRARRSTASSMALSSCSTYNPRPVGRVGTPRGPASAISAVISVGSMSRRKARIGSSAETSITRPLSGIETETTR
ncbi:hypothetical protein D3C76_1538860 [compost metagenome]